MKMRKITSCIAALGVLVTTDAWCADAPASIVVSPANSVAASGDDVQLGIVMTNNSNASIWVTHSRGTQLTNNSDFLVIAPDGTDLPELPKSSPFRDFTITEIKPEEEIHEITRVNRGYDMTMPGMYKILVTCHIRKDQEFFDVDSNYVSVTVSR